MILQRHERPRRAVSQAVLAAVLGSLAFLLAACGGASPVSQSASTTVATIPPGLVEAAAEAHVSDLRRIGPAGPNDLGFFAGTDESGQAVVALASDSVVNSFVPQQHMTDYLTSNHLYVYSTDSGSGSSVTSRDVLGQVSPDVARVAIELQGGATTDARIVDQSFVYTATDPSAFATTLIAYDASGQVLARHTISPPTAPATG
jgi:hypothetical protein